MTEIHELVAEIRDVLDRGRASHEERVEMANYWEREMLALELIRKPNWLQREEES